MLERNRIYNMDCLDGLRQLPADSVDLTVTSPPYDNLRNYRGYTFNFEEIASELYRVTKPGGVVVWVVGDATIKGSETGTSFRQALGFMDAGFFLHDTMIYEKDSIAFPDTNRYYQIFEYMFILSKGRPKTTNLLRDRKNKQPGKKLRGGERRDDGTLMYRRKGNELKEYGVRFNIWRYPTGFMKSARDKIAFQHPAIFPEQLALDHVESWSKQGDLVLDPFMGSGTTAKAAILLGRQCIGFEVSAEYCEIARQRLELIQQ